MEENIKQTITASTTISGNIFSLVIIKNWLNFSKNSLIFH